MVQNVTPARPVRLACLKSSIPRVLGLCSRLVGIALLLSFVTACSSSSSSTIDSLYEFQSDAGVSDDNEALSEFKGKVALVVNITSKCGTTPQLEGLEQLYQKYRPHGFIVLGFPTEDFGQMDLDTNEEVVQFCQKQFDVSFPIFPLGKVSGSDKQAVYRYLTDAAPREFRGDVTFNFEKILVDRSGTVFGRFGPFTGPMSTRLKEAVEEAVGKSEVVQI